MSDFLALRFYRIILYFFAGLVGLSSCYTITNTLQYASNNILSFMFLVLVAIMSVLGILVAIDTITLLLNVSEGQAQTGGEVGRLVKTQQELVKQIKELTATVNELRNASGIAPSSASNVPMSVPAVVVSKSTTSSPSLVQVRARIMMPQPELCVAPDGQVALGANGVKLSAIQGQGIYLTARSESGQWYKFRPDGVSDAWIKAESLQILDVEQIDYLPIEG